MKNKTFTLVLAFLGVVMVYLFYTAPPPLDETGTGGLQVSVKQVLEILNEENRLTRELYTKEIVGHGKKAGLDFDENWRDDDIQAGPLPAQFLREVASTLEKSPVTIGLYLGSDYPINQANLFEGKQMELYRQLKRDRQAQFFYVEDIQRYAYMFEDVAVSSVCTDCHNNHDETPKDDWELNDVMGATTWTYPDEYVDLQTALELLAYLRKSFARAYQVYLDEMQAMSNPPEIGTLWPKHGYYLPTLDSFMDRIDRRNSRKTLLALTELTGVKVGQNREGLAR